MPSFECKKKIRASICVLTFNAEKYLNEQLESIIMQLNPEDEIIILDNNSSDATCLIIEEYAKKWPNIRAVFLNKNLGVIKGFEFCISLALGGYIFLCDQDDVWLPMRLERQLLSLENSDLSVCNASFVDKNLMPLGYTSFELRYPVPGLGNLYKNAFIGCTLAMTSEFARLALPFPSDIPMHDWYIAQFAYKGGYRVKLVSEVLHLYRRHQNTASRTGSRTDQSLYKRISDRLKLIWHTI
jgi:glycosyltransferase involved in cell wall biosynthesis